MKKVIKKVLEPKKTFEQWALDNDIELLKRNFKSNKKALLRWISATAVALTVCLAFIFPVLFSGYPDTDPEPRFYLGSEAVPKMVGGIENFKELEEFFKLRDILFFDLNQIKNPQYQPLYKEVANDNENLTLSYYVEDYFISFKNDEYMGFLVNFKVVTYKNYTILDSSSYSGLSPLFNDNNPAVQYKITTNLKEINTALVKFSYGGYEYFLRIEDMIPETLSAENLQIFLSDLFI